MDFSGRPLRTVEDEDLADAKEALESLEEKVLSRGAWTRRYLEDGTATGCGCVMVAVAALRQAREDGCFGGKLTANDLYSKQFTYPSSDLIDLNDSFVDGGNDARYTFVYAHIIRERALREVLNVTTKITTVLSQALRDLPA